MNIYPIVFWQGLFCDCVNLRYVALIGCKPTIKVCNLWMCGKIYAADLVPYQLQSYIRIDKLAWVIYYYYCFNIYLILFFLLITCSNYDYSLVSIKFVLINYNYTFLIFLYRYFYRDIYLNSFTFLTLWLVSELIIATCKAYHHLFIFVHCKFLIYPQQFQDSWKAWWAFF